VMSVLVDDVRASGEAKGVVCHCSFHDHWCCHCHQNMFHGLVGRRMLDGLLGALLVLTDVLRLTELWYGRWCVWDVFNSWWLALFLCVQKGCFWC
jgi:hypothetical protein